MNPLSMYVLFSLIGNKKAYNLEKLFHRGIYALNNEASKSLPVTGLKALGITKEYSWDDKLVYIIALGKAIIFFLIFVIGTIVNVIKQSFARSLDVFLENLFFNIFRACDIFCCMASGWWY